MPQRTDITGQRILPAAPRAPRALQGLAATVLALAFATAPMPVRATSVLSDGRVSPTSGTTATAFTFSVHYASTSPPQPANPVQAQVGGVIVALTKVSGTALDGTWQGSSALPAGTWQVTFHATTAIDPQPDPMLGPIVTVTEPPTPTPTPRPPPTPSPRPPTAAPTAAPTEQPAPGRSPAPLRPGPQPTPPPTDADDPIAPPSALSSSSASASASAQGMAPSGTPSPTAEEDEPGEAPASFEPAADDADAPPGSRLASLLIVGGAMSLGGAAVLARQWHVTRRGRSR